jgi:acetylornithine deacetylase/succinyl-diaminopimelate desuccinylase-like protein
MMRSGQMTDAVRYAAAHRRRFVTELCDFVRFPSVSADPAHGGDVRRCAEWLAAHLRALGMPHVGVMETGGPPLVLAAWRRAGPHAPTLLVYGHYDVQPADPRDGWHSPPFTPVVRAGAVYGRGACDDKGQLFAHVKAIEAWLNTAGVLPVNVLCLFEGEEEVGSERLRAFLRSHGGRLGVDAAAISDTMMRGRGQPAIAHAVRGQLSFELEVRGPASDLHSGNFGGAVPNPLDALCRIIASLWDARGRIAVADFYDRVRPVSAASRAYMARVGPVDADVRRAARVPAGAGESGYSLYERMTIRPALTVNGVSGGYAGAGPKAVIPARAAAKLSVRLVPDQDPREVDRLIRRHLARVVPRTVRVTMRTSSGVAAAEIDPRHPVVRAAAVACEQAYGVAPVFLRIGGTIPVVSTLQRDLGIPTVLMGFALPDDGIHGPNEKFEIDNFGKAIDTCVRFLAEAGSLRAVHHRPGRDHSSRVRPPVVAASEVTT